MIQLGDEMKTAVLRRLGVAEAPPTVSLLEALVAAYIRTVPWESAFRMAKRARTAVTADCPRWPDEFWRDNIERGGGGTCYESNYAFFALLRALGFEGYLTINNMRDSIGCHTACIILLDGQKWLTDVGIPLNAPIALNSAAPVERVTEFYTYTVTPIAADEYTIHAAPRPDPYIFNLLDRPVTEEAYRAATTNDYGSNGLFLDAVIINKIVAERPWRFNTRERPFALNTFWQGQRTDRAIEGEVAEFVGRHFGMDAAVIRAALAAMSSNQ